MGSVTTKSPARPPQTTAAGWTVLLGGVLVVLTTFEAVGSLRSLENRQAVEEFLAEPPGAGLGIGVETALQLMHAMMLLTGACAAAMAVLAWPVLRRSRPARLAVSVLAVPLFLAGTAVGGLLTAVVAAAALLLWLQPSRDWFAGREPQAREHRHTEHRRPWQHGDQDGDRDGDQHGEQHAADRPDAPEQLVGSGSGSASASGSDRGPRAYEGFGTPQGRLGAAEAPAAAPWPPQASGHQSHGWGRPPGAARPRALTLACVITWVTTLLVGVLTALTLLVVTAAPDVLLDQVAQQSPELAEQGVSRRTLLVSTLVVGCAVVLWCAAAALVAAFAFRGASWARVALLVSAVAAAGLSLVTSAGTAVMLLPAVAASVVVACLVRREVRAWFRDRGAMGS